ADTSRIRLPDARLVRGSVPEPVLRGTFGCDRWCGFATTTCASATTFRSPPRLRRVRCSPSTCSSRRSWPPGRHARHRIAPDFFSMRSPDSRSGCCIWARVCSSFRARLTRRVAPPARPAAALPPRVARLSLAGGPGRLDGLGGGHHRLSPGDAAARQLLSEGFVHNRARMVSASFLAKHLLIDFRQGEAHYLRFLTDGDPASNDLGWQWSTGCGVDAQPWFRVFNPVLQGERFDADGGYVRRWIPELERVSARFLHQPWKAPDTELKRAGVELGRTYPRPI